MLLDDYKRAAIKHQHTCHILCQQYKITKGKADKKHLLLNLYYLSGYIIECSIKFGIYVHYAHHRTKDIKTLNVSGITYDRHIKHHRFARYKDYLTLKINADLPLVSKKSSNSDVMKLFNEWDANVRYENKMKCKHESSIINFFEESVKISNQIFNNC